MNPRRWKHGVAAHEIVELAKRGDLEALRVVRRSGKFLGQGLAILADILNPEIMILGSLAIRLGDLLIEPAVKEMSREATPRAFSVCKVVPAALGERIGDIASLVAALYHRKMRS